MKQEIKVRLSQIQNGIVPGGYKKTVVGIVPEEWEETTLSELFTFKNGLNKEKEAFGKGTPIINYTDVWKKRGIRAATVEGKVELSEKEIENYNVQKGDVFFTRTSETRDEIGLSSVLLDDIDNAVFSGFVLRARPINDRVETRYHQYCYSSPLMRHEIIRKSSITTRALTNGVSLGQVAINLPSKPEQKRIADILEKWDKAIELQEQLIEKLEIEKKGTIIRLIDSEKTKPIKLGSVAKMSSGGTPSTKKPEYYDGDIVWVSVNDITDSGKYLDNSYRKLTSLGIQNSSAKMFPKNTVLYAMYASIGECCIAQTECSSSQAILGITTDETKLNFEYLYYYLVRNKDKIRLQGQQGTQANLNKKMVMNFLISLPNLEQQCKIINVLRKMDESISLQKELLCVLKQQQKSMQQLLLTGIVRTV